MIMCVWRVLHILGEFAVVYKGYLTGQHTDEVVAVKTLKGISDHRHHLGGGGAPGAQAPSL